MRPPSFRPPDTPETGSKCLETAMPLRRNGDAVAPERLPRCAGTVMPLRRNGDAVAPERRWRCAGTAMALRRNGDGVARQPVPPMETQSLNSVGQQKAARAPPKLLPRGSLVYPIQRRKCRKWRKPPLNTRKTAFGGTQKTRKGGVFSVCSVRREAASVSSVV